jgi:ferredoxin-nitrite reductase
LQIGFNVELGGYFSIKRNAVSMNGDTFLTQAQVVPYCQALLEVYRWGDIPKLLDSMKNI